MTANLLPQKFGGGARGRAGMVGESLNVLRQWGERVIEELPTYDDDKIVEICRQAGELERQAFRIRGAGAVIIKERVARKLAGGRGRIDTEGVGVRAKLREFAAEVGVDVSTVETDARIVARFGERDNFAVEAETLGREFFREALAAPNPTRAIDLALRKREQRPTYSVKDFRCDVGAMRDSHRRGAGEPDKLDETAYHTVGLGAAAQRALANLMRRRPGAKVADIVTEALIALDRAETKRKS